uniref:Uncharacterized protein n=1 Tax=Cannabis sativa TaxID=3483 RepID=A0A803QRV8_CANSA
MGLGPRFVSPITGPKCVFGDRVRIRSQSGLIELRVPVHGSVRVLSSSLFGSRGWMGPKSKHLTTCFVQALESDPGIPSRSSQSGSNAVLGSAICSG